MGQLGGKALVSKRNLAGQTPLHIASGNAPMMEALLQGQSHFHDSRRDTTELQDFFLGGGDGHLPQGYERRASSIIHVKSQITLASHGINISENPDWVVFFYTNKAQFEMVTERKNQFCSWAQASKVHVKLSPSARSAYNFSP